MSVLIQLIVVLAGSVLSCSAQGNLTTHIRSPESQAVLPNYPAIAYLLTCYHQAHSHYVRYHTDDERSSPKGVIVEEYPWYDRVQETGYSISTKHYTRGSTEHCIETMIRMANNDSLQIETITVYIDVRDNTQRSLTPEESFEFVLLAATTEQTTNARTAPTKTPPDVGSSQQTEMAPTEAPTESPPDVGSSQQRSTIALSTVLSLVLSVAILLIVILTVTLLIRTRRSRKSTDLDHSAATGGDSTTTGDIEAQIRRPSPEVFVAGAREEDGNKL